MIYHEEGSRPKERAAIPNKAGRSPDGFCKGPRPKERVALMFRLYFILEVRRESKWINL